MRTILLALFFFASAGNAQDKKFQVTLLVHDMIERYRPHHVHDSHEVTFWDIEKQFLNLTMSGITAYYERATDSLGRSFLQYNGSDLVLVRSSANGKARMVKLKGSWHIDATLVYHPEHKYCIRILLQHSPLKKFGGYHTWVEYYPIDATQNAADTATKAHAAIRRKIGELVANK